MGIKARYAAVKVLFSRNCFPIPCWQKHLPAESREFPEGSDLTATKYYEGKEARYPPEGVLNMN